MEGSTVDGEVAAIASSSSKEEPNSPDKVDFDQTETPGDKVDVDQTETTGDEVIVNQTETPRDKYDVDQSKTLGDKYIVDKIVQMTSNEAGDDGTVESDGQSLVTDDETQTTNYTGMQSSYDHSESDIESLDGSLKDGWLDSAFGWLDRPLCNVPGSVNDKSLLLKSDQIDAATNKFGKPLYLMDGRDEDSESGTLHDYSESHSFVSENEVSSDESNLDDSTITDGLETVHDDLESAKETADNDTTNTEAASTEAVKDPPSAVNAEIEREVINSWQEEEEKLNSKYTTDGAIVSPRGKSVRFDKVELVPPPGRRRRPTPESPNGVEVRSIEVRSIDESQRMREERERTESPRNRQNAFRAQPIMHSDFQSVNNQDNPIDVEEYMRQRELSREGSKYVSASSPKAGVTDLTRVSNTSVSEKQNYYVSDMSKRDPIGRITTHDYEQGRNRQTLRSPRSPRSPHGANDTEQVYSELKRLEKKLQKHFNKHSSSGSDPSTLSTKELRRLEKHLAKQIKRLDEERAEKVERLRQRKNLTIDTSEKGTSQVRGELEPVGTISSPHFSSQSPSNYNTQLQVLRLAKEVERYMDDTPTQATTTA